MFNWASHGFKYNAKGLGYFFTGAIAGAVSTGVASGVNVAMVGGNFWSGAVGMANGISSTGFLSGAVAGAFGKAWNGGDAYPAKNISIFNKLKLKIIQQIVYRINYY